MSRSLQIFAKRFLKVAALVFAGAIVVAALYAIVIFNVTRLAGERDTALGVARNIALYVAMPDADQTQIAVDVWFPEDIQPNERLPVILSMTRYWRASHVGWLQRVAYGAGFISGSPDLSPVTDYMNAERFIIIKVDARGTGASGGDRLSEWSPPEIADFGEVAKWAAAQSWSNGNVGALGVSYSGNTAEMLAAMQAPQVRAVAPLFSDFDPQFHNASPGGAFNTGFITAWGEANAALDANDICTLAETPGWLCFAVKWWSRGVKPVDSDKNEQILRRIVKKRNSNNVLNALETVQFRDDAMKDAGGLGLADVSPYAHKETIVASETPMLVMAGWMDAATTDGAIARYLTFSNPQKVFIGAWSHGGRHDTDPFVDVNAAPSPLYNDQLEIIATFFWQHLLNPIAPLETSSINYFTMGARDWRETRVWPPADVMSVPIELSSGSADAAPRELPYRVDFDVSSGPTTRWHTQMNGGDVVYDIEPGIAKKRIIFQTAPTASPLTVTGAPALTLSMSTSARDGLLVAYLEAVSPDGQVYYLTEGVLRLLHRQVSSEPAPYLLPGSAPGYWRRDGADVTPDEMFDVELALYASSFELPPGYRLQVSLAGADNGLFDRVPEWIGPEWKISTIGSRSRLVLPVLGGRAAIGRAFNGDVPELAYLSGAD